MINTTNCSDCDHKTNFYDDTGAFHDRCDHEEIKSSNPNNYDRIVEDGDFECPIDDEK